MTDTQPFFEHLQIIACDLRNMAVEFNEDVPYPDRQPGMIYEFKGTAQDLPSEDDTASGLVIGKAELELTVRTWKDENEEVATGPILARVRMQHVLVYNRTRLPTPEELDTMSRRSLIFNAWPFWRELADSTFRRMGLSFPLLPTFYVNWDE